VGLDPHSGFYPPRRRKSAQRRSTQYLVSRPRYDGFYAHIHRVFLGYASIRSLKAERGDFDQGAGVSCDLNDVSTSMYAGGS
jgi:hypothetical protein